MVTKDEARKPIVDYRESPTPRLDAWLEARLPKWFISLARMEWRTPPASPNWLAEIIQFGLIIAIVVILLISVF